jgi:hypothetical protein
MIEAIGRIIKALRQRIYKTAQPPTVTELEFLKLTTNHGEFANKLRTLGHPQSADSVHRNSVHVGLCWFRLGIEHLADANAAAAAQRTRSVYSRSYYAAYNVSKGMRYIVGGSVSLKGDDHHKASELPDDFPDGDRWSETVTNLYENRLRADYDNWELACTRFC